MITKERLEELIEQGKQIWKVYKDSWQKAYQVPAGLFGIGFSGQVDETTPFDELFETKADAEEYAEFGNITRTERLELPSWVEMKDKLNKEEFVEKYYFYSKHFYKANRDVINIDYTYSIYLMSNGLIIIDDNEKPKTLFSKPLTRENYNEARRLCVKLFRGEDV